ncbi:hypothetical protein MFUR16E_32045 [Methylobacterium fujisawaense]|uniref:hypothetical protein n=1 Tax=Methylobacterium fujisawaense TaxID=107400 RepID=UPI002F3222DD
MTGRPKRIALLGTLFLAQPLAAEPARPAGGQAKLPAEVERYVMRRTSCDHWTGEDAYDEARGRDIAAAVKGLRCDTINVEEMRLRRRYGRDLSVLKALHAGG